MPRTTSLGLMLATALLLPQPIGAQTRERLLIDPDAAHARRDVRRIERQLLADPEAVPGDLGRVRNDIRRQRLGAGLDSGPLQLERRLDAAEREAARRRLDRPQPEAPGQPRENELPSSYGDAAAPLPSMNRTLSTIGGLLDRAEEAMAAGRGAQATSDLSTAKALLAGLEPADDVPAESLASLERRLTSLSGAEP